MLLACSASLVSFACAIETEKPEDGEHTGETDEAVQETCSVPVNGGAQCRQGELICTTTSCTCWPTSPLVQWSTGPERCEQSPARDDDCDGLIDEGCPTGRDLALTSATSLAGGSGGTAYSRLCQAGEVMTGFYGANQHGGVISGLSIRCAQLDVQTLALGAGRAPDYAGGGGWNKWVEYTPIPPFSINKTTGFNMNCPAGQMVIGLKGRSGSLVDSISPQCGDLQAIDDDQLAGSYVVETVFRGSAPFQPMPEHNYQNPGPGSGGGDFTLSCGSGGVVLGIYGHAGALIDAIGLYCGRVRVLEDW